VNRIDRLFAITTQLQARGRVRAVDLARAFEVSTRTIYRDIAALSESGVPVVSLPGQGYALSDGYFLPPLVLSVPEATALVLGGRMLAGHANADLAHAADRAVAKVIAILDGETQRKIREFDAVLDFAEAPEPTRRLDLEAPGLAELRQAIQECRVVSLRYFGRNRGTETMRQVEPLRLTYTSSAWYLTAYCRLRAEERAFRLDRIEEFRLEPAHFRPRWSPPRQNDTGIDVLARFRGVAARWVHERQHWSYVGDVQTDGGPVALYRPGCLDEIASWLFGWGASAEVLAPEELRGRLRDEANSVLQMLT
jgi:predicted DNA-binding transcriptional regulator YafY